MEERRRHGRAKKKSCVHHENEASKGVEMFAERDEERDEGGKGSEQSRPLLQRSGERYPWTLQVKELGKVHVYRNE